MNGMNEHRNIDGVYRVEMLGPFGWERFSTGFFQNGHYRGASSYHHTIGSYQIDGEELSIRGNISQDGQQRAIFGLTDIRELKVEFNGTIQDDEIEGEMSPVDDKRYSVKFRLSRLSDLN